MVEVACQCERNWTDRRTDKEVLARSFDKRNIATIVFSCYNCEHSVPVQIKRNDDRSDYEAIPYGGYGDVTVSKLPEQDQFDIDVDAYLDNVVGDDPNAVFVFALEDVDWVMQNGIKDNQTLIRMIFAQLFAIYETYLADRLIRLLKESDEALKSLIMSHKTWQEEPLTFKDAFDAVGVVRERVLQSLTRILYHDFSKVDPIYRAVFGAGIFHNDEDRTLLFKQVQIRHDCVHRNGKTVEGVSHVLNSSQLHELAGAMDRSRQFIEAAYEERY